MGSDGGFITGGGYRIDGGVTVRLPVRRTRFSIVVAADRGLCGAYNSSVIREAERALLAQLSQGRDYSLIAVGRKAESYFRYREYKIDASFTGFTDQPQC